jgi:PAS domain S-box-containing protein
LNHVLGLLAATILATAASGIGATMGYILFHRSDTPILSIWQHWFASDALGIVAFAPMLIGTAAALRNPPAQSEVAEGAVALTLLGMMSALTVVLPSGPWSAALPLALVFPLLLWLAARCSPVFSAAAAFIVAVAIVSTMTFGIGFFGDTMLPLDNRIFAAGAGIVAVSLCALVLAALFAERRQYERALEKSEERMRLAVAASRMGMFDWDMRTGASSWSDEWCRMLGYQVGEIEPSQAAWLARIHPDDREKAFSEHKSNTAQPKDINSEYRIIRGDGDIRWIRTHGRFLSEGGRPVRLIGLKQDVTEARQQFETQRVLVAE